ncbi:hypothetical protein ABZZ79_20120 [Streptomyces sp. NPDC006458]|uniref:hypothetical protein n=1 Tax=Streptomyces sp. NPDC006458 TaxID=3154302 RepID=UPI00339F5F5C
MNNWREDAQPEWPEVASGMPGTGQSQTSGATPSSTASASSTPPGSPGAETQFLPNTAGRHRATPDPYAQPGAEQTAMPPKAVRQRRSPETGPADRPLPRRERGGAAATPGTPRADGPAGSGAGWFGEPDGARLAPAHAGFDAEATAVRFPQGPDADATSVLPPVTASRFTSPGADSTTVLRAPQAADAGATAVLPTAGGPLSFPETGPAATPRDPWADMAEPARSGETGASAHQHDPHEVTVQMDAVQLGDVTLRPVKGGSGAQDAADGPVFVDETGRRSRTFRRLGIAVGLACAVYAVVIVATLLSGSSDAPWLPVPGQKGDKPAEQVDTPARPTETADPSAAPSPSPSTDPTATAGTTSEPGSTPDPGASATADEPDTTADPDPTATATTLPRPGGGATQADPEPTATASEPDPEPTTPTAEPTTPGPTESVGVGSGGGTGTTVSDRVAEGSDGTGPAALATRSSAQPSTSPEYVL